jgi:putative endonuclease
MSWGINGKEKPKQPTKDEWYVYLVRCNDDSLYCGMTNDLEKRVTKHNSGRGAKYTASRRPVELVYFETYPAKPLALKREWKIKQMTKEEKENLLKSG